VCNYFLKGHCSRGDQCRYMHAYSSAPDVELLAELTGHTKNVTGVMLVRNPIPCLAKRAHRRRSPRWR
jgi:hypothetical protein